MRYRSKPQDIEAVQWTGDNFPVIVEFLVPDPDQPPHGTAGIDDGNLTLLAGKDGAQGWVPVPVGHWIVRNPSDLTDHWPVDPDYFVNKYSVVFE
ncbi:MAG TPA: hypothetical protein VIG24_04945 [Acidimicrobiia bacterium]